MALEMFGDENTCIKIYNPTTQILIDTRDNYCKAANFLGLSARDVWRRCGNKTRVYSPILGIEVAVRLASNLTSEQQVYYDTKEE